MKKSNIKRLATAVWVACGVSVALAQQPYFHAVNDGTNNKTQTLITQTSKTNETIQLPSVANAFKTVQVQTEQLKHLDLNINALVVSPPSEFTLGLVHKHQLNLGYLDGFALFIVGTDALSAHWLQQNLALLQKIHAIGLVVDAKSRDEAVHMSKQYHLFFSAANLRGLSQIIGTTHYPVLLYQGWVTQ